ncbi:MAG: hypothetical protein DHS80DRAFT_22858 [Piptocephalis tieghemiana]|nr:MAG: hypothetical protein DHS80DRAFT_22858 [Piptocephalis tieghemiana]
MPYPSTLASYNVHQQGHAPQAKKSRSQHYAHRAWNGPYSGHTLSPLASHPAPHGMSMAHPHSTPPPQDLPKSYQPMSRDMMPPPPPLNHSVSTETPFSSALRPTGPPCSSSHLSSSSYWHTHPHQDDHGRREEPGSSAMDTMPIYLSPPPSLPVSPDHQGEPGAKDVGSPDYPRDCSPRDTPSDMVPSSDDHPASWNTVKSTPSSPFNPGMPERGRPRVGHRRSQSATLASLSIERTTIRTFYTASGRTRSPVRTADRLAGALVLVDPTTLMERYRSGHPHHSHQPPPLHVKSTQTDPLPASASSLYPSYSSTSSLLPPPAPTQMDTQVRSMRSMAISELLNPITPTSPHPSSLLPGPCPSSSSSLRKRPRSPTPPPVCKVSVHPDHSTQGFSL